jgi:hypothetical protein
MMRKPTLRRLDSPLLPLLLIAIVAALFIFGLLRRSDFNASTFVTAGDRSCDPALVPPNLLVRKNSDGFDGQFYYRLALDPLTSKQTDFGITLDIPALRHQRILYPLLARALSLGSVRLVPAMMILINFFALCFLGWLGGVYAQSFGRHALWGIFLPLYPGSLLTLTRDLVELLEVSLLLGSLLLLRRNRPVLATLLLVFALLAKETALVVAVAALLVYVTDKVRQQTARVRWFYFAIPLAAFVVWQLILFYNWGEFPILADKINVGTPLTGFLNSLIDKSSYQTPLQRRAFPELIFLIAFALSVFYCLRATLASLPEKFSLLLYAALALFLNRALWIEDWTFLRAVTEFCVTGTIILIGSRSKIRVPVFACSLVFWLFLFVRLLRHGD